MDLEDKLKLAEKHKRDALYAMGIDEGKGSSMGVRVNIRIKNGVIIDIEIDE